MVGVVIAGAMPNFRAGAEPDSITNPPVVTGASPVDANHTQTEE